MCVGRSRSADLWPEMSTTRGDVCSMDVAWPSRSHLDPFEMEGMVLTTHIPTLSYSPSLPSLPPLANIRTSTNNPSLYQSHR